MVPFNTELEEFRKRASECGLEITITPKGHPSFRPGTKTAEIYNYLVQTGAKGATVPEVTNYLVTTGLYSEASTKTRMSVAMLLSSIESRTGRKFHREICGRLIRYSLQ